MSQSSPEETRDRKRSDTGSDGFFGRRRARLPGEAWVRQMHLPSLE